MLVVITLDSFYLSEGIKSHATFFFLISTHKPSFKTLNLRIPNWSDF